MREPDVGRLRWRHRLATHRFAAEELRLEPRSDHGRRLRASWRTEHEHDRQIGKLRVLRGARLGRGELGARRVEDLLNLTRQLRLGRRWSSGRAVAEEPQNERGGDDAEEREAAPQQPRVAAGRLQ